jgi:hypothetical protein
MSRHLWTFGRSLVGTLAVIAVTSCDQPVDAPDKDHSNRPMTRKEQVDHDVTAIIEGMARAHGARAVASMPVR